MPVFFLSKMITFIFAVSSCKANGFFGLPPWYKYLDTSQVGDTCDIVNFRFEDDFWKIGLAVLEMLLRVAGMVAVFMIIFSGVSYIMASGEPEKAAAARRRLYNSLIGLAIALVATGFVAFIGNKLI
jgi:hypothetical protein